MRIDSESILIYKDLPDSEVIFMTVIVFLWYLLLFVKFKRYINNLLSYFPLLYFAQDYIELDHRVLRSMSSLL